MKLDNEQEDLLVKLVEAERRVPRQQRHSFQTASTMGGYGVEIVHEGWQTEERVFEGDITLLAQAGLVNIEHHYDYGFSFFVTPQGFDYYRQLSTLGSEPLERVETRPRTYISGTWFRERYPQAAIKWISAEELLWGDDRASILTTVGHLVREAFIEFADQLATRHGVAESLPDRAKFLGRIRAVLAKRSSAETPTVALEALLGYLDARNALVQRQEHGAQRESQILTWSDARRLVFLTAVLFYEIDQLVGS